MDQIQNDFRQLQIQIEQLRVFCEAVADAHSQGGNLRDILHKNTGALIYRKSQPWFKDLDQFAKRMRQELSEFEGRISNLEEKFK